MEDTRDAPRIPRYLPSSETGIPLQPHMLSELPLRDTLIVLWKYRFLLAAVCATIFFTALIAVLCMTPRYAATSKIRIGTYEPIMSSTGIEDVLQQKSKEPDYLDTQIQEVKSLSLADRVLQDPEVRKAISGEAQVDRTLRVQEAGRYRSSLRSMQNYLDSINVHHIRRTSLVAIEAIHESPFSAALIANAHAQHYIDWVRTSRMEQQSRGLLFLKTQADELKEKVADLERELADYAEANSIVAVNKDENIVLQKMAQLNKVLTEVTSRRIESEKLYEAANAALQKESAGFDDTSTQAMRTDLAKLEGQYNQLAARFTSDYPKMKELAARIAQVKRSIRSQRQQIVTGLRAKADAAMEEERLLREELDNQTSQAFELSKREVQYNVLNRELTTSRELLSSVLKQIKETSLAIESNSSNITIVDYAVVPAYPSYPRKGLILGSALVFGLALGMLCALLLHYFDNTVRTPEELHMVCGLPALGLVPAFDTENERGAGKLPLISDKSATEDANGRVVFLDQPSSLASEAYRQIRTGIMLSRAGEPPRSILGTSAQSSEGKTTTMVNLAASLAGSGARVLLIDGDLRRPTAHRYFDIDHENGLVEVLSGIALAETCIRSNLLQNLDFLPSGRIPPNPSELLGSKHMALFLEALEEVYDFVLIDSPPVLPVTDAAILARLVDGVVLVVRASETPGRAVREARDRLERIGATFLGAILNDVDLRSSDYYYYRRYYCAYNEPSGGDAAAEGAFRKQAGRWLR